MYSEWKQSDINNIKNINEKEKHTQKKIKNNV